MTQLDRLFVLFLTLIAPIAVHAGGDVADQLAACARIGSGVPRLDCFDNLASRSTGVRPAPVGAGTVSNSLLAVAANERGRAADDMGFRMTQPAGSVVDGSRVFISAPAKDATRPKPLLVIACIDRITRLQLVVHPPLALSQAQLSLSLDGRPLATNQSWQVLEGGRVLDAGRGLPAIDVLRRVNAGGELRVQSDLPAIDGLRFDTTNLPDLLAVQRKACRW